MKTFFIILLGMGIIMAITGCENDTTVQLYTDRMAVIDIVTKDFPTLFQTNLIKTEIPDTSVIPGADERVISYYWREITGTGRKYVITADYPDTNEYGEIPVADVELTDTIKINFSVIAWDTTANPDTLMHLSKPANELVTVRGKLEQWGDRSDARNGWLLTGFSGAYGRNYVPYDPIDSITFTSFNIGERTYNYSNVIALDSILGIMHVATGEVVQVTVKVKDPDDKVTIHVGKDEFTRAVPDYIGDNMFRTTVTSPGEEGFFHITVDVIQTSSIAHKENYTFRRWGVTLKAFAE